MVSGEHSVLGAVLVTFSFDSHVPILQTSKLRLREGVACPGWLLGRGHVDPRGPTAAPVPWTSLPGGEAGQSWTTLVSCPICTTPLLCDFGQVTLPL